MAIQTTEKGIEHNYDPGYSGNSSAMNENLRRLSDYGVDQWATDDDTTSGLTYGYRAGSVIDASGAVSDVADGTITLADNDTSYVERTHAGVVSANTSGFTTGSLPMAIVEAASGAINRNTIIDRRAFAAQVPTTTQAAGDNSTKVATTAYADNAVAKQPEIIGIACSDETTAVTTGTAKATFRMPFAMTVSGVRATVTPAPTGSTLIVDINEAGTTILSTKLSIDASEKTSTTAASAAVISDTSLADDAEMTIDFDQVGSTIAGAGVKVWLIGTRT